MNVYLDGLEPCENSLSTRSVLRYPGGKFRARKILEESLPNSVNKVFSPFLGGGSFELHLTGKNIQVSAIDKFFTLANFWKELQKEPVELADGIQLYLNKVDSETFKQLQAELRKIESSFEIENTLDTAIKFFVVNRCSFSGATLSGGFSKESARTRLTQSIIDKVRAWNNSHLEVEYGDCHEALETLPPSTDFLFLDPPYLLEAEKNSLYGVSGHLHKGFDHIRFHEQVVETNVPFLLTYNNDSTVREIWKDFKIVDAEWSYGMNKSKKSSEIIITNY